PRTMSPSKNSLPVCACALLAKPSIDKATADIVRIFIQDLPLSIRLAIGLPQSYMLRRPFEEPEEQFVTASGLRLCPGYLNRAAQEAVLAALREVVRIAPIYTPRMPNSGKPMSVRMTNCGPL